MKRALLAALGVAAYGIGFGVLVVYRNMTPGQAVGAIVLLHFLTIPCFLCVYVLAAPLGKNLQLLASIIFAPLAAGHLSIALVNQPGTSPDLQNDVQPCYDRQGEHRC